ncbi:hypothetical protein DN069_34350 [Streptacidiphilus pinicola]|uniref:DUF4097 domain-containing protein n=1 Tax=Streptacidiphilus pinicola TaxID=2219663 RepID=A0A2X0ICP3_9ACTN|nr:DUF4097 family beta strand repeat-containing protein [Streptacidiphilus pinicola]RAG81151.1 hypothetical protein DN069_34350 [Streptacidiphilus pinicola]
MQKFAATAPVTAVLNIAAGRIQVIAADRTDTTVDVRPANPAKSRDVKAAEQTTVAFADGTLRIGGAEPRNQYFGPTGSVEITLQVPTGSHLDARTASCELRGVGRLGDITFEGAYQHIKIDEAANVRLTAVDGDVEIGRLGGPAQITTARGAITVEEATHGAVVLATQMGDITVGATPGASASLDAGTGHGRVSNALKNNGTIELDIRATTGHGNITARSL